MCPVLLPSYGHKCHHFLSSHLLVVQSFAINPECIPALRLKEVCELAVTLTSDH